MSIFNPSSISTDPELIDIAGLTPTDGGFIVGDSSDFVLETGNTARTSLGLGTSDSPSFTGLSVDTDVLLVDSAQNRVGINDDNPISSLSVGSGTVTIQNAKTDSSGLKILQDSSDYSKILNYYTGKLGFGTNDGVDMAIDGSGNLAIGHDSPSSAIDAKDAVQGTNTWTSLADCAADASFRFKGSNHANGYGIFMGYANSVNDGQGIQATRENGGASFPLLLNPFGGNVGIGDLAPSYKLDVDGDINCTGVLRVDDVQVVSSQGSAIVSITDNTGVTHNDTIVADGLTDSSGGSTDGTISAVTDQSETTDNSVINDNFAEVAASISLLESNDSDLAAKIEEVLSALRTHGLIAT